MTGGLIALAILAWVAMGIPFALLFGAFIRAGDPQEDGADSLPDGDCFPALSSSALQTIINGRN